MFLTLSTIAINFYDFPIKQHQQIFPIHERSILHTTSKSRRCGAVALLFLTIQSYDWFSCEFELCVIFELSIFNFNVFR